MKKIKQFLSLANREEIVVTILGDDNDWDPIQWDLKDLANDKLSFFNNRTKKTKIVVMKKEFPNCNFLFLFLRGRFKGIVPVARKKEELDKWLAFFRRYYLSLSKDKRKDWEGSIRKIEELTTQLFRAWQKQHEGAAK